MKLFISLLLASVTAIAGDLEEMYKSEVRQVTSSEFTSKFKAFKWGWCQQACCSLQVFDIV